MRYRFNWRHIPILLLCVYSLSPLLLLLNTSVKSLDEVRTNPLSITKTPRFANFSDAWIQGGYSQAFANSFIVSVSTILIICAFGGLAAYALAKIPFRFSDMMLGMLLFVMSIPMGMFLVPLFFTYQRLGLMDTLLGVIIIYSAIFLPFNIFLLRSFFVGVPDELLDSARVDGCSEMSIVIRMMTPLALPSFSTVALIVGLWTWNEFFFANAFLQSNVWKTVATRYLVFTTRFGSDWPMIAAAGVITIAPIVGLFAILQRRFIEGITEGSIKG